MENPKAVVQEFTPRGWGTAGERGVHPFAFRRPPRFADIIDSLLFESSHNIAIGGIPRASLSLAEDFSGPVFWLPSPR